MTPTEAGRLLDHLDVVKYPCDLDLLVFFARHPRTLLSSDQIAGFLGYEVKAVAASLELLLESGFVTRTPNRRHAARMFVLSDGPLGGGWLPALTRLATTRPGRLALLREMRHRSGAAPANPTREGPSTDRAGTLPLRFPHGLTAASDSPRQDDARPTDLPTDARTANTQGGSR